MAKSLKDWFGPEEDKDERAGVVQGRTEALGNGLTMGWGPRAGAAMQAGMAGLTGGDVKGTYNQALGENRDILDREHTREPKTAVALEVTGGVPGAIAMGSGSKAASFLRRMRQALNTGGKVGLLAGAGSSKSDLGTLGNAADAGIGMVSGAALGPIAELGGMGAGRVASKVKDIAAKPLNAFFDKRATLANQARVMRVADELKKQILDKVEREGATWTLPGKDPHGPPAFKMEGMSGFKNSDIIDPITGEVKIPAASDAERELFERSGRRAAAPPEPSFDISVGDSTRNIRPISSTAKLEPTAQSRTENLSLEEILRALGSGD